MEDQLHFVQINILRQLLFRPNSRFSDLNVKGLTSDHFTFHVKRLVEEGWVEKIDDRYRLTTIGKEFANRMDTDNLTIERQAKTAVLLTGVQRDQNGQLQFLLQKRLKEPFFGLWGCPTGKVRWGETVEGAAQREFEEETGLTGQFFLKAIRHKINCLEGDRILEDKFFYTFRVEVSDSRTLKPSIEGGENAWFLREEIKALKTFEDIWETLDLIESPELRFVEKKYFVSPESY